jgi:hypothetical protein
MRVREIERDMNEKKNEQENPNNGKWKMIGRGEFVF